MNSKVIFLQMTGLAALMTILQPTPAYAGVDKALVCAPQTEQTICIDGVVNEKEWGCAASLQNFSRADGKGLAENQTEFRVCRDENNLYLAVKAYSFPLVPASNQRDAFKAEICDRDGNVWQDDSLELRLGKTRPESTDNFYIAFNALGTVLDMRNTNDGWQRRWNASIIIATKINDGFWVAEIAIPFSDMDSVTNRQNDQWLFNLVRFDRFKNQISSWSDLVDGNHMNSDNLGILQMGGVGSPVVKTVPLSAHARAAREIQINVDQADMLLWQSTVAISPGNAKKMEGRALLTGTNNAMTIKWSSETGVGQKQARISLFDRSRTLIYRSPAILFESGERGINVKIENAGDTELFINGQKLTGDSASNFYVEKDMRIGPNVVAIRAKNAASLNCKLEADGVDLSGESVWKYAFNPTGAWESISYDDSSWPVSEIDKIAASTNEWTYLRRVIMNKTTRMLPSLPEETWHLTSNGTYVLSWSGSGLEHWPIQHELDEFELVLDVPGELEFLGASWRKFPLTGEKESDGTTQTNGVLYSWQQAGIVTNNGVAYTRFIVQANYPVTLFEGEEVWLDRMRREDKTCSLAFRGRTQTIETNLPLLYYYSQAFGGAYLEVPNTLYCSVSPMLNGSASAALPIMLKVTSSDMADENIATNYFNTLHSAGLGEFFGPCYSEYPKSIGLKPFFYFNLFHSKYYTFSDSMAAMDELFDRYPEARGMRGSQVRFGVDPSYVTRHTNTWPLIKKAIAAIPERNPGLAGLFWDYEFAPLSRNQSYPCLSQTGIDAFKAQHQITGTLTPTIIAEKYKTQWIDFSCGEVANMIKLVHQFANECGLNLYLYSGYQNAANHKEYYNTDWVLIGSNVDKAICGYGEDSGQIEATRQAIAPRPLSGGILRMGRTAQWNTSGSILRKIIECGGVLLWHESQFDARALEPIAEASRVVARFERVLLEGERKDNLITVTKNQKALYAAYRLGDEILVLVYSDQEAVPVEFEFSSKVGVGTFQEFYTGSQFDGSLPIKINIPRGKIRAFSGRIGITCQM